MREGQLPAKRRSQRSLELECGRAAALLGLPASANPYRSYIDTKNAPYRVDELARNWDSGWASIPREQRGKLNVS
jgi:hypothetical protein